MSNGYYDGDEDKKYIIRHISITNYTTEEEIMRFLGDGNFL